MRTSSAWAETAQPSRDGVCRSTVRRPFRGGGPMVHGALGNPARGPPAGTFFRFMFALQIFALSTNMREDALHGGRLTA